MTFISLRACVLGVALLLGGCTLVAPQYSGSLQNVEMLKSGGSYSAKVGHFDSSQESGNANPISLRGNSLTSPYDGSYARYLEEALKQELSLAGKLAPDASVEVSGVLQKNDINIPGLGDGTGDLQARFVVKKSGTVQFDRVKVIHDIWSSSFVGAVAIPRAQEQYPKLVQRLLSDLYADPDFIKALQ